MSKTYIPKDYKPALSLYETQKAIGLLKRVFEDNLCNNLNLTRVSAPLFVDPKTGLNDNLSGIERPVAFDIKETGKNGEVVHSLAKWKRLALHRYNFKPGEGICTDMNAIRRDEVMDNLHSIYVDQWDWEKIIPDGKRTLDYLKETVSLIVQSICITQEELQRKFPALIPTLSSEISFITSQELEDLYPNKTPKEREDAYLKKHKTAFIMQIGDILKSGQKHDDRAPDYDDWQLNGDIMFYCDTLQCAFEISSMGIRVDSKAMDGQLKKANADDRRSLPFHKLLLEDKLPLTIGGGIGQSRLSLILLKKAHIGEVQASIWDDETKEICEKNNITLL